VVTATGDTVVRALYDGWHTAVLDPNGHQRVSTADAFGRVTEVREYTQTLAAPDIYAAPVYAQTEYTYDVLNHLTGGTARLAFTQAGGTLEEGLETDRYAKRISGWERMMASGVL
jgi:hypothetical protein